jgi:hypothetical protein
MYATTTPKADGRLKTATHLIHDARRPPAKMAAVSPTAKLI